MTWITKLLAGEAHCEWAAWFRAHHTYDKLPGDFDLAAWTARHTEQLRRRVETLRDEGWDVFIEHQNAFKFRGRHGTVLAGKPDLVAARDGKAVVIDCKTGTPRVSDQLQVLIYMIILPLTHDACRDRRLSGELAYRDDTLTVGPEKVTPEFRRLFRRTMHRIGGRAAPHRVPSYGECRFCDIASRDCPDRVESPPAETGADHVF